MAEGKLGELGEPCRDVACYVWKMRAGFEPTLSSIAGAKFLNPPRQIRFP